MAALDKIPALQNLSLDDVYNAFLGMDRRGQIAAAVGLVAVLLALLFLPVTCVSSKLDEREDEYREALSRASEIYGVLTEYARFQKNFEGAQDVGVSGGQDVLQNLVYDTSEEIGIDIKKHRVEVKSQKPETGDLYEEISKEVTMTRVPMDQALKFMHKISGAAEVPVKIKKFNMVIEPRERNIVRQLQFIVATITLK